jgi:hypothetical protein
MKVRACLRCHTYVLVKEGYQNQQAIKLFEKDHTGHVMGTVDYIEVRNGFTSVTNEYMDRIK